MANNTVILKLLNHDGAAGRHHATRSLICAVSAAIWAASIPALGIAAQNEDYERDPEVVRNFQQGRELRRAGKLEEAAAAYERVLARAPRLAVAHLNLGLVRHDQRDYKASTEAFARALALDPALQAARLYLGIDAYLGGRYDLARPALEEAARRNPADAEPLYWLGLTQAAQGDFRTAADSLEAASQLRPKDDDTLYQLQEVYLQLWKSTYERLVAANPDSIRIHQVLAEGYIQSNRLEDAKAEYEFILRAQPRITGVREALGDIARGQRRWPEALEHYRAELQASPSSARLRYKIAEVLFDAGDFAGAEQEARKSVALQEGFAPAHYVLGRLARQARKNEAAIAAFQKSLALGLKGPLEESAHYQLWRLFAAAGRAEEAARHQKEYVRLAEERKRHALYVADRERKVEDHEAPPPQ
jgi:tetratricopeptide (TPR) repeat protein